MRLLCNHLTVLFLTFIVIESIACAPSNLDQIEHTVDLCQTDDLLICNENDFDCETKNSKRRQKRQAICRLTPQCQFCNDIQPNIEYEEIIIPEDILEFDNENLVVPPEIVPTLSPPIAIENIQSIPVNETIIIDSNISTIADKISFDRKSRDPGNILERNIVIENDNETQYYRGFVDPSSNITTIIRLTNLINNTNVINMPTTLNNTNINNIHLYSNKSSATNGKFGLGYSEDGPCCWSMKPGSCKTTTAGLKCRHKKAKVCGKQCDRKMIHPGRTMCNTIPQWPFIICPPSQNNPSFVPYSPYYPSYSPIDEEFDDDYNDDFPLFPEDEELENPESGWIVMQEKCKVVSEDGLHITNCSDINTEFEHPFARNSIEDHHRRYARQTGKYPKKNIQNSIQQQNYGYPIVQPIYLQPISLYIPQYYVPHQNGFAQQLPFPPVDTDQYYNQPIIQSRDNNNQYRKLKKLAKKHPIIIEHDEEL